MAQYSFKNETGVPLPPAAGYVKLYARDDQYFYQRDDGTEVRLAGSNILFDTGPPSGSLGEEGDVYVDASTGGVYQKTGPSTWTFMGTFSGVVLASTPPATIGASNVVGTGATAARDDHVHAHGSQAGGTTHANATTSVAGFMSAADKVRVDSIETLADGQITAQKGVAGGLATLDGGGKVPVSQLPTSVMEFKGVWDASTNTPTLSDGAGSVGDVYRVSVAGTQDLGSGSVTYGVGDLVILDASLIWRRSDSTDAVSSVNGFTGTVTLSASDVGAPPTSRQVIAGAGLTGGGDLSSDKTINVVANADGSIVVNANDIQVGVLATDAQHGNRGNGSLHTAATTSVAGFMSSTDKTKLDGVATGATNTPLSSTAPVNVTKSAASAGSATEAARQDHKHDITTAAPSSIGTANSEGSATSLARSDHVHNHGAQTDGSLHAVATTSVAGFMSATDKSSLDNLWNPVTDLLIDEEFLTSSVATERIGTYGWTLNAGGTGNNQTPVAGVANQPGIFRLQGGTVATARSCIHLGGAGFHNMVLGGGVITFQGIFALSGTISAHLQSACGLGDSFTANGDQANGVYIRLLGTDTNWKLVSASGGTRTVVDLGVAYSSGTYVRLGFQVNSAGTSIQGLVNGSAAGSAITTNIPSIALSPFIKTDAIAAGTALNFDTDKFFLKQTLSR